MTHAGMRLPAVSRLAALLTLAALTGCSSVHRWAQASSGHSPTAGASVSLPFGK